jgi:hypothetical protein
MKTLRYPPGKPGFTAKDAKGAKEREPTAMLISLIYA